MRYLLTALLFLALYSSGSAQSANYATPGTYQFLFFDRTSEEQVTLTRAELKQLELLRHAEATIFVRISEKTLVKLLPGSQINATGFDPSQVEEKIYFRELDMETYHDVYRQAIKLK
jgi:hypothetical protein